MRSSTLPLLLIGACSPSLPLAPAVPATAPAAPATAPAAPATAPAAPTSQPLSMTSPAPAAIPAAPDHATFFVAARKDKELFVLAYHTETGALEPVGGALPWVDDELQESPPPKPTIECLWHVPGDRVFAFANKGSRFWQAFAGAPGRAWRMVAAGGAPHISDDGELVSLSTTAMYNGQEVTADEVVTWDGKVIYQTRWPGPMIGGFLEHGRQWMTVERDGQSNREVHGIGVPPRPGTAADHWYDPQAEPIGDRYRIEPTSDRAGDDVLVAFDRKTAREVARYQPPPLGTHRRRTYVLAQNLRGEVGAVVIAALYETGGCGDVPCVAAWATDLWILGRGEARVERLRKSAGHPPGLASVLPMIDAGARHVVWIADRAALEHYDIATGARRRIATNYELLTEETPRR